MSVEIAFGAPERIDEWMRLVAAVRGEFPGLETEEALAGHRGTVLRFMARRQALCALADGAIAGVLLFSRGRNMICCLAVAPGRRRRGAGAALLAAALAELDRGREISVSTFRAGDPKGAAPRALYAKYGFEEAELTVEFGYPNQRLVLRPRRGETSVSERT